MATCCEDKGHRVHKVLAALYRALPPLSSLHGVSLGDLTLATTDAPFMTFLYEVRE